MQPQVFALVDCNTFYCSCERVFQPKFNNHPVIVLSNNDGCAVAISREAKALGVKMGAPYFQIRHLIAAHKIKVFSSNYKLYGDMSHRVMKTLEPLIPHMEIYSIDEAFLDFSTLPQSHRQAHAHEIRRIVDQNTGIPVSIGIASTKTLAKIAGSVAKKNPTLGGVFDMSDPLKVAGTLPHISCGDIWGVGLSFEEKLRKLGVHNAAQLAKADTGLIKKILGVQGLRLVYELRGVSCLHLDLAPVDRKSVVRSRSFGRPVTNKEEVHQALQAHLMRACEKLREQGLNTNHLTILIHGNRFSNHAPYVSQTKSASLPCPTNYTPELARVLSHLLDRAWQPGSSYTKAGVMLTNLTPDKCYQGSLFDAPDQPSQRNTMSVIDNINKRFGRSTIGFASALSGLTSTSTAMKCDLKSPDFTTCWKSLCVVK